MKFHPEKELILARGQGVQVVFGTSEDGSPEVQLRQGENRVTLNMFMVRELEKKVKAFKQYKNTGRIGYGNFRWEE